MSDPGSGVSDVDSFAGPDAPSYSEATSGDFDGGSDGGGGSSGGGGGGGGGGGSRSRTVNRSFDLSDLQTTTPDTRAGTPSAGGDPSTTPRTESRFDAPGGGGGGSDGGGSRGTIDASAGADAPGGIDAPTISGASPTVERGDSVGIADRIESTGSRLREGVTDVSNRLPGRTGEAFAVGAGIAAIPEPTPATEVTGATIAGGAALAGGAILASRAARDSELEPGDLIGNSELDPTRSQREVNELMPSGSAGIGNREIEPGSRTFDAPEIGIGSVTGGSELDVGGGTAGGTAEDATPPSDSVVPGEFPVAGRDFPLDPRREFPEPSDPTDVIGGAETATGVTIGEGTGSGTTGSVDEGTVETPTITIDEIVEGARRRGRQVQREFPTGAGAVVGRETGTVDPTGPELDIDDTLGLGTGIGLGETPNDPLAPPADRQRGPPTVGPGFDIGTELGTDVGPGIGTGTGTGPATETGTEVGAGTDTLTGADTATEQLALIRAEALTGTQTVPAMANEPAIAQGTAFENLFANPTAPETLAAPGTTVSSEPPRRDPRPPLDPDNIDPDEFDIEVGISDAVVEFETRSLAEIDAEIADIGGGLNDD